MKSPSKVIAVVSAIVAAAAGAPMSTAQAVSSRAVKQRPVITQKKVYADGVSGVADSSSGHLFKGGDARVGVLALIKAGAVTINDAPLPAPADARKSRFTRYKINGGDGLWKNADGTWSWTAHITIHGENESYADAAVDLVNAVSTQRGLSYTLLLKNGKIAAIDEFVYDAAFANRVKHGARFTTIKTLADNDGDGSTNKPNPASIRFPNRNVAHHPAGQSMVKYWRDAQGWHLVRAKSRQVFIDVNGAIPGMIPATVGGKPVTDSRISLQYSMEWNRPSQPVEAMLWIGDNNVAATQWFGAPGVTIGFSLGGAARSALQRAIATATSALQTTAVSVAGDGSDVAAGKMWVTQSYHDIFTRAVVDAQNSYDNSAATNDVLEGALFHLSQAYGAPGGQYSTQDNPYFGGAYNGIGFVTFARGHLGTQSSN